MRRGFREPRELRGLRVHRAPQGLRGRPVRRERRGLRLRGRAWRWSLV